MAIVQITKMQMRRGTEIDLPGAPSSLSPLVFKPGLSAGEIGFAVDTGRMFFGHDPRSGQSNFQRTTFPYQNVEILTENSFDALSGMFGAFHREVEATSFYTASIVPSAEIWRDIETIQPNGTTKSYFFKGLNLIASLEYFLYSTDGSPIRQGTLRLLSEANQAEASVSDTSLSARRTDRVGQDHDDPNKIYENIYFRALRTGSTTATSFRFQYRSTLNDPARLLFNVVRPQP